MTALNIFLQSHRALVMTDAFVFSGVTGEPVGFADKCAVVPGTTMAIATRGDVRLPAWLAGQMPRFFSTIDQVCADDGSTIQGLYKLLIDNHPGGVLNADVEFFVVGWSGLRHRPRGICIVFNKARWRCSEIGAEGICAPLPSEREFDRLAMLGASPDDDYDLSSFDPIRHGIPLMEAQRRGRHKLTFTALPPLHVVGGHILLTEITCNQVAQSVIHRWPDEPGKPLKIEEFVPPRSARQVA